jgi:hypothetical protein
MLGDENYTKSSYSMTMKEFQCHTLIKKLNEKKYYDIMHRKKCTLICQFINFWQGTSKTFTLKFIIQRLLYLYNKDI